MAPRNMLISIDFCAHTIAHSERTFPEAHVPRYTPRVEETFTKLFSVEFRLAQVEFIDYLVLSLKIKSDRDYGSE